MYRRKSKIEKDERADTTMSSRTYKINYKEREMGNDARWGRTTGRRDWGNWGLSVRQNKFRVNQCECSRIRKGKTRPSYKSSEIEY